MRMNFKADDMFKLAGLDQNQREGEDMMNAIAKNSNLTAIGHRQRGIANDVVITGKNVETRTQLAKSDFEGNVFSYMEKFQSKQPQAYQKFLKREQFALNAGTNPYEQEYTMRRLLMNRLGLFIRTIVLGVIFACPHFFMQFFWITSLRNYWNCVTSCECCSYWHNMDIQHCSDPANWCTFWSGFNTDQGVVKNFGCQHCHSYQECCVGYMFLMFMYKVLSETWNLGKDWWNVLGCEDTSCFNWLYHIKEVEYQRSSPENKYRTQLSNRARSRRHHHMVCHELQMDKRNNADKIALYNAMTKQDKMFTLVSYSNRNHDKKNQDIILPQEITIQSDFDLTTTTTQISITEKIDEEIKKLFTDNVNTY